MDYALQNDFLQAMFRLKSMLASELGKDTASGISMPEYILLKGISENKPLTEIREYLYITKPAVSQMLASLEKKAYLLREPDKSDRRNLALTLTPAGQTVLQQKEQRLTLRFGKIAGAMREEDLHQVIRLVSQFSDCVPKRRKSSREDPV